MLTYSIIIPAFNEDQYILQTLESITNQTLLPQEVVIVDDNSVDKTYQLVNDYIIDKASFKLIKTNAENKHLPGAKVIRAFQKGFENMTKDYDIIVKLDADLILPSNYFEVVISHFQSNNQIGMVGGFAYIKKNKDWILESLTNDDHIRGAFKSYRKKCYEDIGGLSPNMGWDTLDEMLARYHGWIIKTDSSLHIKHLKPTGFAYHHSSKGKQGLVFYQLGYGFWLTFIATLKLNIKKKRYKLIYHDLLAFFKAVINSKAKLVNLNQQKFIQNYRWNQIKNKLKLR